MQLSASIRRNARVQDLSDADVTEGELQMAGEAADRLREDELTLCQGRQRPREIVDLQHGLQLTAPEDAPADRGALDGRAAQCGEALEITQKDVVHGHGLDVGGGVDGVGLRPVAAVPLHGARGHQVAGHLADEEGVPSGLGVDRVHEAGGDRPFEEDRELERVEQELGRELVQARRVDLRGARIRGP